MPSDRETLTRAIGESARERVRWRRVGGTLESAKAALGAFFDEGERPPKDVRKALKVIASYEGMADQMSDQWRSEEARLRAEREER